MSDIGYRRVKRRLTTDEAALVAWLLTHAAKGPWFHALIPTVANLRVVGEYEDGVSVDFEPPGPSAPPSSVIALAHGKSALGVDLDVSLRGRADALTSLVVYDWAEGTTPFTLPKPAELRPTTWPT